MNLISSQISSPSIDSQYPDFIGAGPLSIALIGPDGQRRKAAAKVLAECHLEEEFREFSSYPSSLDDAPRLLGQQFNVILIDLDSNPEYALELVESISANSVATVAVYSEKDDPELVFRCMRSGVREFMTLPFTQSTMAEALVRAAARRPANCLKKAGGRLLVFFGAKGGAGVTMIACNFAAALAQDPRQSTLLIDLNLPFGDAALNLGLEAEYSTINALQNASRLDSNLLSKLLVKHSSGLNVLAAPGKFPQYRASNDPIERLEFPLYQASDESIQRLVSVARQDFDNVVVDVGSKLDFVGTALFKEAMTIYLVTQAGLSELRNSNRLIGQFFSGGGPKLEVVINRHEHRTPGINDEKITKALTRPAEWQIPNDDAAVRQMQKTATPLVFEDSPISRLIRQMASSVTGQPAPQGKKKGFSFGSLRRSASARNGATEEPLSITEFIPTPASAMRPFVRPNTADPFVYSPFARSAPPAELRTFLEISTPTDTSDLTDLADTKPEDLQSGSTANQQSEPETCSDDCATDVKGADVQMQLRQMPMAPQANIEEKLPATLPDDFAEWDSGEPPATLPDNFDDFDAALGSDAAPQPPANPATAQAIVSHGVAGLPEINAWRTPATAHADAEELSEPLQSNRANLPGGLESGFEGKRKHKMTLTFAAIGLTLLLLSPSPQRYHESPPKTAVLNQSVVQQPTMATPAIPARTPTKPSPAKPMTIKAPISNESHEESPGTQ